MFRLHQGEMLHLKMKDLGLWHRLVGSLGLNAQWQEEIGNAFVPWTASAAAELHFMRECNYTMKLVLSPESETSALAEMLTTTLHAALQQAFARPASVFEGAS